MEWFWIVLPVGIASAAIYAAVRQAEINRQRKESRLSACREALATSGFQINYCLLLADRETLFALSRATPGVATSLPDGRYEIIPIAMIKEGRVSNLVETTVKTHGGSTGYGFGNVFVGSSHSTTRVDSQVRESWLQLKVRDYDRPDRWFQFPNSSSAQRYLDRVALLLEEHPYNAEG